MNEKSNYTEAGNDACMMFLVTKRGDGDKYTEMLRRHGARLGILAYGSGTAPTKILDILGIGHSEYDVTLSPMSRNVSEPLMAELRQELKAGGSGIAFTIPTDNAIGNRSRKKIGLELKEDNSMDKIESASGHSLIVVITNSGYSEEVMGVARGAGATGGTVIHARGTGLKSAKTFFGVTIQPEKDMILIVAPCENAGGIMGAIDADESLRTDAHPVSFSLPVDGLAGFGNGFSEE